MTNDCKTFLDVISKGNDEFQSQSSNVKVISCKVNHQMSRLYRDSTTVEKKGGGGGGLVLIVVCINETDIRICCRLL